MRFTRDRAISQGDGRREQSGGAPLVKFVLYETRRGARRRDGRGHCARASGAEGPRRGAACAVTTRSRPRRASRAARVRAAIHRRQRDDVRRCGLAQDARATWRDTCPVWISVNRSRTWRQANRIDVYNRVRVAGGLRASFSAALVARGAIPTRAQLCGHRRRVSSRSRCGCHHMYNCIDRRGRRRPRHRRLAACCGAEDAVPSRRGEWSAASVDWRISTARRR